MRISRFAAAARQYARDPSGLKSLRMTPEEGGSINGISTIYDIT